MKCPQCAETVNVFGSPRYASMGSPDDTVVFTVRRDAWEAWHRQASAPLCAQVTHSIDGDEEVRALWLSIPKRV